LSLVSEVFPVRDSKGNVIGASKIGRDIADLQEAEQSTNLLAAIVDCSDDAIISKNLDGIITSWNKSAERIFGYSPEEAIGQHISLIIPPERHAEESDILDHLRRGDRVDHFHTVRRRKDGSLLDASLTISPVRDTSGRVIGASKVARDITTQMRAERSLRESEQRFRMITDASPIMVWMSGTDKLCYYFNKGWLDFVGRTLEQESGNGWAENVHTEDFDRCLQIYVSNFDARRPFEMEYRMRHRTGQFRWILDRGVPRYAPDGTFEGYVGACLDIHDQKEAAEKVRIADDMTRLMKAQDEERRRIARELHDSAGQTLTVVGMSLARLLHQAESSAPELAREGKKIETMVQQLHREIRTTSYLLHPPLLDETGLASALKWYVEGLAERSHVAITLDVADNVGRLPNDMELAIFRLVQECLTNIHRHSGSKTAFIRVVREEETVRTEVQDHGKGISPERLLEIQSHGSGVGLRGIRERIRQFHGEMKIESNGSGTSVIVRIPMPKEARSADSANSA
jgi:PAS domain S-box-containing protein